MVSGAEISLLAKAYLPAGLAPILSIFGAVASVLGAVASVAGAEVGAEVAPEAGADAGAEASGVDAGADDGVDAEDIVEDAAEPESPAAAPSSLLPQPASIAAPKTPATKRIIKFFMLNLQVERMTP